MEHIVKICSSEPKPQIDSISSVKIFNILEVIGKIHSENDSASDDITNFEQKRFSYFDHNFHSIESIQVFSKVLDSLDSALENCLIMFYSKNRPVKRYGSIFSKFSRFFLKFQNFENFKIALIFILSSETALF